MNADRTKEARLMNHTSIVRGRVWKSGKQWCYEVRVDGALIAFDDCRDYTTIQRDCGGAVYALRRVLFWGYKLTPKRWPGLS